MEVSENVKAHLIKIRRIIIILVPLLFILLLGLGIFQLYILSIPAAKNSSSTSSSKVWQIVLSFNPQTKRLFAKSISVKKGKAKNSPFHTSSYKLFVLDKNRQIIFQTDIAIAEYVLYDIYFSPDTSLPSLPQPNELDTIVTIPYFDQADSIEIIKGVTLLLKIIPPKAVGMNFTQAFADVTCDFLHIVFIGDGYSDMNKFHADVAKAKNTFISKEPFASHQNIFDFKTVDNPITNPLGCVASGHLDITCIYKQTSLTKIANTVFTHFPALTQDSTYTKIVVLVDGSPEPVGGGFILGVANALGGQFGVFQDQLYFETTATMEVLGHDVGQLYDRYLYPSNSPASQIGGFISAKFLTNCTTNPSGENFWKDVGVTKGYPGCTSSFLYAPSPRDCGNGGSRTTIMSAAQCAGSSFDIVEQRYLASYIIPKYQCMASTVVVPSPTQIPSITPSSTGSASSPQVPLTLPPSKLPGTPTPQTFTCVTDPSCHSGTSGLQLCPLKCTAQ